MSGVPIYYECPEHGEFTVWVKQLAREDVIKPKMPCPDCKQAAPHKEEIPIGHYKCVEHGEFSVVFKIASDDTRKQPCPECGVISPWYKGHVTIRVKRSWEDQANIARANPADQMKAQLDSVKKAEEAREKHGDPRANFMEGE